MKHCLILILAALLAVGTSAQGNRIYIDDFEIYPDSTVLVPVMLANSDTTRGVQFYMNVPEGLVAEKFKLNDYAREYGMQLDSRFSTNLMCYVVFEYPYERIGFPPDTAAVLLIEFYAEPSFRGGELTLWNCRGSTLGSKAIIMEGGTTNVTVPNSSLIGIPMDSSPESNQYFNLMGLPVLQPDSVPVVIEVTTDADGRRSSRKVSYGH